MVLSNQIYKEFHAIYGYGQNPSEQFEHFLREKYNMTQFTKHHGNHEPNFTIENVLKELEKKAKDKQDDLIGLIHSRNHELISRVYENANSIIVVKCKRHGTVYNSNK